MGPMELLSRRQRQSTPLRFCRYLIDLIGRHYPGVMPAVLWVRSDSTYYRLLPCSRLWNARRDARTYPGPWPVICHPPCGPWGKYKHNCHHSKLDGIIAMNMVHVWGGIVEHPVGSSLFREHGRGGEILKFDQGDFGHRVPKPTLLYCVWH